MKKLIILGMVFALALMLVPTALAGSVQIEGDFTVADYKATIPCNAVKGLMHSPSGQRIVLGVFLGKVGLTVETSCLR